MEQMTLTRRNGDSITNYHLQRLATEGWMICGARSSVDSEGAKFVIELRRPEFEEEPTERRERPIRQSEAIFTQEHRESLKSLGEVAIEIARTYRGKKK